MSAALQSVDLGADGASAPAAHSAPPAQPTGAQDDDGRDVVYSQQQQSSGGAGPRGPPSSSAGEAAVNVQIGTPAYAQIDVQPCDTMGGPNFYSISAHSAHGGPTSVRRRFNDLVALHENLKVTFRGCVIPFRPGKTPTNSSALRHHKDTFLRDRAFAIKCYLVKVAHHPEIKESTVLKQFMESTEILRTSAVWSQEQPHKRGVVGGFVKSMRKMAGIEARIPTPSQVESGNGKTEHDLVRQMAETRINRKKLHETDDEEEKALLDLGDALPDMCKANLAFAAAAASVIDAAKALIDAQNDNGADLRQLLLFEKDAQLVAPHRLSEQALDVLAACVDTFGRCISNTASITRQMAILDPANDHAFMLPRVEKAMAARIDALVVLESMKRQQSVIEAQFKQLLAKESSGTMSNSDVRRMNRARSEVDQVEQAKAAGERTHGLLQRRNRRDVAWYRAGREQQFAAMVLQFAEAQAALQASLGELWLGMVSRTGSVKPGYGADLEHVALPDLGMRTSESAAFVEPEPEDNALAADTAVSGGAVPAEHAEQAENAAA